MLEHLPQASLERFIEDRVDAAVEAVFASPEGEALRKKAIRYSRMLLDEGSELQCMLFFEYEDTENQAKLLHFKAWPTRSPTWRRAGSTPPCCPTPGRGSIPPSRWARPPGSPTAGSWRPSRTPREASGRGTERPLRGGRSPYEGSEARHAHDV